MTQTAWATCIALAMLFGACQRDVAPPESPPTTTAIQGFGNAQFVWNFQLYRHQQEANTLAYGDGRCDAEFGLTGTVPGSQSYTTHDVHWE